MTPYSLSRYRYNGGREQVDVALDPARMSVSDGMRAIDLARSQGAKFIGGPASAFRLSRANALRWKTLFDAGVGANRSRCVAGKDQGWRFYHPEWTAPVGIAKAVARAKTILARRAFEEILK